MTEPSTIEKLGVDERFLMAANSRNLRHYRLDDNRTGDTDYLLAAAMSRNTFGMNLLRLLGEWGASERGGHHVPNPPSRSQVADRAAELVGKGAEPSRFLLDQARKELEAAYSRKMQMLMAGLKSLPTVRLHLLIHAELDASPCSEELMSRVLLHWLHPACPVCKGRKFKLAPDGESLSDKACDRCRGSGHRDIPMGEAGKGLLSYMDDCLNRARDSLKKRLSNTR